MIVQFAPIGPMEHLLVDRIVHSAWRLRRIGRIEVEAFDFLRNPADEKPTKIAIASQAERSRGCLGYEISACPDSSPFGQCNRFSSFDEAKAAWFQTEDGVLYTQDKWPCDPDYPSPVESFSNFIKPPKQPEPLDDPEILSDAIDLVRSETDSKEDIAKLDEPAETQTDTQREDPPLTLGRAFVDGLQRNGVLIHLSRYESNIERSMFKNLWQLQHLQSQRASIQAAEAFAN
jgi:hypothetical protein